MPNNTSETPTISLSPDNEIGDIFQERQPPLQRPFLGAALRDYRPVSGASTFTQSSDVGEIAFAADESYDTTSAFIPKDSSVLDGEDNDNSTEVQGLNLVGSDPGLQKNEIYQTDDSSPNQSNQQVTNRRRRNIRLGCAAIATLVAIIVAVVVGAVLGSRKNSSLAGTGSSRIESNGNSGSTTKSKGAKLWGNGGETIKTTDGRSFFYNNTLGGTWVSIPFNDTAKPQGNQPTLAEDWNYSENRVIGINLGGWLVVEPFIVPALFEPYVNTASPAVDEWTLCQKLATQTAATIENHYKTFITEQDFAEIASAGLNWIRLPVGWWMIETWANEPFLEGVSFKYFLLAITWARKYGLRINLDLHSVPGSQNGWNHSGKFGTIGFMRGAMGIANAQRTLNYVRTLTQFISQPQYKRVVPQFSVLNEAQVSVIGAEVMRSWYYQVYQMLRSIGGTGEGNGPFMMIHDGFIGQTTWNGFLRGADRLGLDTHTYFCFGNQNTDSVALNAARPCQQLATFANTTSSGFGLSITGEFSLAINDCGLYVNNVGYGSRFEGTYPNAGNSTFRRSGSCTQWLNDRLWTAEMKNSFADFAQTQQDVYRNSYFWTWKIGNSTQQDNVPNPMWNYQGGLRNNYIRQDARTSNGRCAAVIASQGGTYSPTLVPGDLAPWQVGKEGAGQILASEVQKYQTFPPANIGGGPGGLDYSTRDLPQYVATGNPVTLVPTPVTIGSNSTNLAGNGWANPSDTSRWWVAQPGCQYPDPWGAVGIPAPRPICGA